MDSCLLSNKNGRSVSILMKDIYNVNTAQTVHVYGCWHLSGEGFNEMVRAESKANNFTPGWLVWTSCRPPASSSSRCQPSPHYYSSSRKEQTVVLNRFFSPGQVYSRHPAGPRLHSIIFRSRWRCTIQNPPTTASPSSAWDAAEPGFLKPTTSSSQPWNVLASSSFSGRSPQLYL